MSLEAADYVDEEYESNPFIPHERMFSKYAVMLYYSQDAGKNYYIHQDCRYCESCHDKVITFINIVTNFWNIFKRQRNHSLVDNW